MAIPMVIRPPEGNARGQNLTLPGAGGLTAPSSTCLEDAPILPFGQDSAFRLNHTLLRHDLLIFSVNAAPQGSCMGKREIKCKRPVWAAWPAERDLPMMGYVGTSQVST